MSECQPNVKILVGDCREKLKELPAQSVHCIVTSPPYWGLRDYGVAGQIGLESDLNAFYRAIEPVFKECFRVLRDDGTMWVNMGDTYQDGEMLGVPWGLANAIRDLRFCPKCGCSEHRLGCSSKKANLLVTVCQACGFEGNWHKSFKRWRLRQDVIWHKPNPVPEPDRGRCTVAHEYLHLFSKRSKYFWDNDAIREPAGDEPDWDEYEASLGTNVGCDSHRWSKGYKKMSHSQIHPNGRQKRSVWTIPTKGFPGAHFATFPPKLVEPCIMAGTSEKGCCSSCGAPRKRITEMTPEYQEKLGKSWNDHQDDLNRGQRGTPSAFRGAPARITTGWEATCQCDAGFIPCTVLDPFGGSGTTGEVALNLGRSAVMIELNPEYVKFIEQRTSQLRLGLTG